MKFINKLANIKDKTLSALEGKTIRRRYVIFYVGGFVLGLGFAWFWLADRLNNPEYYLRSANTELVELTRHPKDAAKLITKVRQDVRQAVYLSGASDPRVAEAAAQISEALISFDQNSLITASEYYDLQSELEPGNAVPYWRKAVLRVDSAEAMSDEGRRQVYLQALMQVEQAINIDPKFAEAYYTKAVILEKKDEFDLAIEAAKTSLVLSNNPRTSLTLSRLLLNRGFSRRGQSAEAIAAKKLQENADLSTARNLLLPLSSGGPEQLNALYLLVDLESRLGNQALALAYCQKLAGLLPDGEQKSAQLRKIEELLK